MTQVPTPTFRFYFEREYAYRLRRNPRYSMRSFARDLNLLASRLSDILHKKTGLSAAAAQVLVPKMKLDSIEAQHFLTLVEAEHSRSRVRRKLAQEVLQQYAQGSGYDEIDLERFKIISDWYHMAILELTELPSFSPDVKWISRRLGVASREIKLALERLLEFGLLEKKSGSFVKTRHFLATPSGIPNREIREFHQQVLQKASHSVDQHSVNERDLSAIIMAVGEDQLELAKKRIKEFRRKLNQELDQKNPKDRVYCLAIQFFPMDQKLNQKEDFG